MFGKRVPEIFYINERSRTASEELAQVLSYCILQAEREFREVIFLCIGSDRITGDSLGPLIGHQLALTANPAFSSTEHWTTRCMR